MNSSDAGALEVRSSLLGKIGQTFSLFFKRPLSYAGATLLGWCFCLVFSALLGVLLFQDMARVYLDMFLYGLESLDAESIEKLSAGQGTSAQVLLSLLKLMTLYTSSFVLAYMFVILPVLTTVNQHFGKAPKSLFACFDFTLKRFLKISLAVAIYYIVMWIGVMLLVVPGIYFAIRYVLFLPLMAFNGLGVRKAFSESARLMKGRKLKFFLFSIALVIIVTLSLMALGFVFGVAASALGFTYLLYFNYVLYFLTYGITIIPIYLFYKEAVDAEGVQK